MVPIELMKQLSLAETGSLPKAGKQTRKAVFLAEMETVVPWSGTEYWADPDAVCAGQSVAGTHAIAALAAEVDRVAPKMGRAAIVRGDSRQKRSCTAEKSGDMTK